MMAERALPGLALRPLTLLRCPNGCDKECFYQKHATQSIPDRVGRVTINKGEVPYTMVKDLAGIVSLVQIAVIEFHVWGARADRIERPDLRVFDLDPIRVSRGIGSPTPRRCCAAFSRTSGSCHSSAPPEERASTWSCRSSVGRVGTTSSRSPTPSRCGWCARRRISPPPKSRRASVVQDPDRLSTKPARRHRDRVGIWCARGPARPWRMPLERQRDPDGSDRTVLERPRRHPAALGFGPVARVRSVAPRADGQDSEPHWNLIGYLARAFAWLAALRLCLSRNSLPRALVGFGRFAVERKRCWISKKRSITSPCSLPLSLVPRHPRSRLRAPSRCPRRARVSYARTRNRRRPIVGEFGLVDLVSHEFRDLRLHLATDAASTTARVDSPTRSPLRTSSGKRRFPLGARRAPRSSQPGSASRASRNIRHSASPRFRSGWFPLWPSRAKGCVPDIPFCAAVCGRGWHIHCILKQPATANG